MVVLSLAPILSLPAAAPLRSLLIAHRGEDVELDASGVERLGGLCLQVLIAARKAWRFDRKAFRLVNLSVQCRDVLRLAQAHAALGVEE